MVKASVDLKSQREKAKSDILNMLSQYGKCAFIRPTGWGKTWTTASIVDEYKKVLYIYPSTAIRNTFLYAYWALHFQPVKKSISNVTLLTYSKLRRLREEDFKILKDVDLIIADECDILGAPETMRATFDLLSYTKGAHLLGATATPERQDMIDEISIFFEDHLIADYSLHDAVVDGIIKKPYYCTGCFDETADEIIKKFEAQTTIQVDLMAHKADKQLLGAFFKSKQLECSNFLKMEKVIPMELEAAGLDTDYQKYIVFFSTFSNLEKQSSQVKSWFTKAFPDHTIQEIVITSKSSKTRANVAMLDKLTPKSKTIQLIYTCNMMNMGYHVDTLTGIMMLRGTGSSHIFIQQLGRVLSTGSVKPGIVFDVVDNLHRPAIYKMYRDDVMVGAKTTDGDVITADEIQEYVALVQKTRSLDEDNKPLQLSYKERNRLIKLKKKFGKIEHPGVGRKPLFTPEDFVISFREATVREIMAKAVAEPISMRCRQAWSRWKSKGGDDSIMTREYILSQKAPDHTPLPPFCHLKHVSVEAVLDEMGVVS